MSKYKDLKEKISNRAQFCVKCEELLSYSAKYDSTYCKVCNEWMEKTCGVPDCIACADRPPKPRKDKCPENE